MRILIPYHVEQRIWHWVHKADFEVSGFGMASFDVATQTFNVHSVCLLKQEGGSAHTDIDPTALSRAQYLLRNEPGDLRFWWHSHVNMSVFMSPQDQTTIKDLGAAGWCLAAVYNKKNERKTAVSYLYATSFDTSLKLAYQEDLPIITGHPIPTQTEIDSWDQEFQENVVRHTYKANQYWPQKRKKGKKAQDQYDDFGYELGHFGYGDYVEAKILGLTITEYDARIAKATEAEMDDMEMMIMDHFSKKLAKPNYQEEMNGGV